MEYKMKVVLSIVFAALIVTVLIIGTQALLEDNGDMKSLKEAFQSKRAHRQLIPHHERASKTPTKIQQILQYIDKKGSVEEFVKVLESKATEKPELPAPKKVAYVTIIFQQNNPSDFQYT